MIACSWIPRVRVAPTRGLQATPVAAEQTIGATSSGGTERGAAGANDESAGAAGEPVCPGAARACSTFPAQLRGRGSQAAKPLLSCPQFRMRCLGIGPLTACVALCARAALASEAPVPERIGVRLEVDRQPGTGQCIETAALERAVEARLARPVFVTDSSAPLLIRLRLAQRGQRHWSAELRLETDSGVNLGERTLTTNAPHCSALDDSLALIVALLVDAPLSDRQRERERAPAAPSVRAPKPQSGTETNGHALDSPATPQVTRIELPASTLAPRQPWRWEASVGGSLALGFLPGAALGVELGVSGKPPDSPELRLFAGGYAPREAQAGPNDAGAGFAALFVGLEVCPLEGQLHRLRWSACAGQSVGWLHAAAFGYDQNSSTARLIYTLLARGVLQLPLGGPVSARLTARAELPLARPAFVYGTGTNGEGSVFEMNPLIGAFEAGLSFAL